MQRERWSSALLGAGLALWFACLLWPAAIAADSVPAPPLPNPESPRSHEAYLERVNRGRTETFQALLARYDEWLTANPDDITVALERCRFVLSFAADEEELDEPAVVSEDCVEDLTQRFPDAPAVLQFRFEQLWGEEAVAFGLATIARKDVPWTMAEHAALMTKLAYANFAQEQTEDAARWALEARALDSRADVGLILATHWHDHGVRRDAIAAELVHGPCEAQYAQRRVELLVEIEAFARALELIEACRARQVTIAQWVHAQALAGAGRKPAARAKYAELAANEWTQERALRETFYLDLLGNDRARAVASYAALRDRGFSADPFLRHRLALLTAFPGARWALRDALGALAMFALCIGFALVPGVIVVPIHYFALVRRARGAATTPPTERWSLRHLWAILAALLLAELLGWYFFAYAEFHALILESVIEAHHRDVDVARALLITIAASAAGVLIWLRRGDYARLVRSSWSPGRIAGIVLIGLFFVNVLNQLSKAIASAAGLTDVDVGPFGVELTTLAMLRTLNAVYGGWLLFLVVAVVVPVYEEVAFRGIFLGAVSRYLPFAWANALQAAAFTLAHDEPVRYAGLFALGLFAGAITRRSGGIAPAIALHATMNALVAIVIVLSGSSERPPLLGAYHEAIDPARLARRCQSGEGQACARLGHRHRWAQGVAEDWGTAARFFDQGCQRGFAPACHDLGVLHYAGNRAIAQDFTRAAPLFDRACHAGFMRSCGALGQLYNTGRGVPQDLEAGARLLRKACSGGDPAGCSELGFAYASGNGVPRDHAMSARFYRRGCDAGNMYGCMMLGNSYVRGEGVALDFEAASALMQQACDGKLPPSCTLLAKMYSAGIGVEHDPKRADALIRKACDLGDRAACAHKSAPAPAAEQPAR